MPGAGALAAVQLAADMCGDVADLIAKVIGGLKSAADDPDNATTRVSESIGTALTSGLDILINGLAKFATKKTLKDGFAGKLANVGETVAKKVAEVVATPVKAVVDKVMAGLGFGGKDGPAVTSKDVLVLPKGFTSEGKQHKIWIDGKGSIRIASEEKELSALLDDWEKRSEKYADMGDISTLKKDIKAAAAYKSLDAETKKLLAQTLKVKTVGNANGKGNTKTADLKATLTATAATNTALTKCFDIIVKHFDTMQGKYEPLLRGELEVAEYKDFTTGGAKNQQNDALAGHHVPQGTFLQTALGIAVAPYNSAFAVSMYAPSIGDVFFAAGRKNSRHGRTTSSKGTGGHLPSTDPDVLKPMLVKLLEDNIDEVDRIYTIEGLAGPQLTKAIGELWKKNQDRHKGAF